MIDVERDGRIGFELEIGTISFKSEAGGTFAIALVDVLVGAADATPEHETRVQLNVKIPADPEQESIIAVTERFRGKIVATLRATADALESRSARALLLRDQP